MRIVHLGIVIFEIISDQGEFFFKCFCSAFFRIDDYVIGNAREEKITRILNSFSDDPDLGAFLKMLAEKVRAR